MDIATSLIEFLADRGIEEIMVFDQEAKTIKCVVHACKNGTALQLTTAGDLDDIR